MTSSSISPYYRNRYQRQGRLAVLCEGDVAGFEVDLIEKITSAHGETFVDVWACGTKTAIHGLSDAIGRSIPLIAIEDRDFRSPTAAAKHCERSAKDRQEREVNIVHWRTWARNEIENYFIEPQILFPVVTELFEASESQAQDALLTTIESLRTEQSALAFLDWLRDELPDRFRVVGGLPRRSRRVRWSDVDENFVVPDLDSVRQSVMEIANKAIEECNKKNKKLEKKTVKPFDEFCSKWDKVSLESVEWKVDWAGKDLLTHTMRFLYARYGLRHNVNGLEKKAKWQDLQEKKKDGDLERAILRLMQPLLIQSFLGFINGDPDNEMSKEWFELVNLVDKSVTDTEHS